MDESNWLNYPLLAGSSSEIRDLLDPEISLMNDRSREFSNLCRLEELLYEFDEIPGVNLDRLIDKVSLALDESDDYVDDTKRDLSLLLDRAARGFITIQERNERFFVFAIDEDVELAFGGFQYFISISDKIDNLSPSDLEAIREAPNKLKPLLQAYRKGVPVESILA